MASITLAAFHTTATDLLPEPLLGGEPASMHQLPVALSNVGVTWTVTLVGPNGPCLLGTLIYEGVKLESGGRLV
jgi:hypothetical protein